MSRRRRPTSVLRASHLKYYKHSVTDDVFNHIRHVYGEVTFGSQVGTRWGMEDGDYDKDDARVMGVH
jgi:hypothetical protein